MTIQIQIKNDWQQILFRLFSVPGVVVIQGEGKIGKTDFALRISEDLMNLQYRPSTPEKRLIYQVASNIDTKNHYLQIADLFNIKEWLYKTNVRKLYIFDEATQHLSNLRTMSSENFGFTRLLPQITKAHARMVVIGHNIQRIDKGIIDEAWCKGLFVKTNLKNALLFTRQYIEPIQIDNIRKTSIPFDPYAVAPFSEKPQKMVLFKDEEKNMLWNWSQGSSYKELGIHAMQLNRLLRKYVAQTLEIEYNVSH